jgi:superfamily II DNA/RNA helicase
MSLSAHEITFADLGTPDTVVQALRRVGITHPFPIQAMTLPVAMSGHDVIGQAKTGTGKTLGFAIPVLVRVSGPDEPGWDDLAQPGAPQALVVVPTRELAIQVAADIEVAGALRATRVLTVYGGRAYEPQTEALRRGVEVVVGTPGRLLDLAQQGHLRLRHARTVVLDEADEMLDLGFLPDVERLLAMTPTDRQTMLFSATMPGEVVTLARRYMTQPTHIRAADPDDPGATVRATAQFVYRAHSLDKPEILARVLQARGRGLTIIFTPTKRAAARVAEDLTDRGFAAAAIHGDLGQGAREQALRAFRKGKIDVLVATDVAARGIDVEDVTHVINYACPEDEKTYLHRIGRTGRAGNTGTAITLVDWDDMPRWALIDRALDLGIPEPEETYSTSAHLFTDLEIPEGTRGTLPRQARTRAGLEAEEVEDLGETGRARQATPGRRGRPSRRGSATGAEPAAEETEPRPRRARRRRRTRGGRPIEGDGPATAADDQAEASGGDSPEGSGDGQPTRRRRRRRGGGTSTQISAEMRADQPIEQPIG